MKCLLTVVLLLAEAMLACADILANHRGDKAMPLIIGIVVVVISVALWKMIQSRKKRVIYEEVVIRDSVSTVFGHVSPP